MSTEPKHETPTWERDVTARLGHRIEALVAILEAAMRAKPDTDKGEA